MAKKYQNNKNLLIIQMSWREYSGITGLWSLCDLCGEPVTEEDGYYIPLIDNWYCKTCLDAYLSGDIKRSRDDLIKERENYNKMVVRLRDIDVWEE